MKLKSIILPAVALLLSACDQNIKENNTVPQEKTKVTKMAAMPLTTIAIARINPAVPLQLAGELRPDQETALFAKIQSYVKVIHVDIGSKVSKGQILMILEAPELQAQIVNAKAKIHAQEAIYIATKANYDRMYRANETKGAIARDALDQITAQKLSDEAKVKSARAAYTEIQDINQYLIIRAPFSGVITARNTDIGAYVGPMGGTPLLVIQNSSKLRLNLSIPEANVPYIAIGDTINFNIRALPEKNFQATISRKSGALDLKLRSEKFEADFINNDPDLKPFMVAEAKVLLKNNKATFFIPRSALVEGNMGIYVIKNDGGNAKFIPVKKGRALNDKIEVFGALADGDHIIKMANEEITEGTTLK